MLWGEFANSLAGLLELPANAPACGLVLNHFDFEFGHNLRLPQLRGKPWATGVTRAQPLFVAVDCGDDQLWAGQPYCFVKFSSLGGVVRVPNSLTDSAVDGCVHFAVIRWLTAHASVTESDELGRPVCPGLDCNHALWQYEQCRRDGLYIARATDSLRIQLDRAGVSHLQWRQKYQDGRFDLIQIGAIRNTINIARDPDTTGLLQTVAMPGTQN